MQVSAQSFFVLRSTTDKAKRTRQKIVDNILFKEFQLVYYGKFDLESLENLSLYEFEFIYNKLIETFKKEKQEREQAQQAQQNLKNSATARIRR